MWFLGVSIYIYMVSFCSVHVVVFCDIKGNPFTKEMGKCVCVLLID